MEITASPKTDREMLERSHSLTVQPPTKQQHLATLDGLRGLAALAVLVVHVIGEMHLETSSSHLPLDRVIPHVHLAVDFFFMLSGFVLAKAYEKRLIMSMSVFQFMLGRLIRLYPLIFVGAALGALSLGIRVIITHVPSLQGWLIATLSAFAILPTTVLTPVFHGELFPVNFPEWSLLFELVINFFYAATARWLGTRKLIVICVASLIVLSLSAASSDQLLDIGMGLHQIGVVPADIWCGLIRITFSFSVGIVLFRGHSKKKRGDVTSVLVSVAFLAVLFMPKLHYSWKYEVTVVAFIFPIILYLGATCQVNSVLNKTFLFLGELSYPLYITHNPVTKLLINVFKVLHVRLPDSVALVVYCLSAVVAALILLRMWDQPVRKWLSVRVKDYTLDQSSIRGAAHVYAVNPVH